MKRKFLKNVAKNPKLVILTEIKKSQGLSVADLCDRVGLSYMGVKQHCVALEREGYLDTWRRPKAMGRPEKTYRLTERAQEFFPNDYSDFTCQVLDSVKNVYGSDAPEKILFNIYKRIAEEFEKSVTAVNVEERARQLAQAREEQGYMSEYSVDTETKKHQIVEFNNPIIACMDNFPILKDLEVKMFEKLLGTKVTREEERVSGLYKSIFRIG
jgi:predicted ArsR family transcriptional regulator